MCLKIWVEMAKFEFIAECEVCKRQFECYTQLQASTILQNHSATHFEAIDAEYRKIEGEIFKQQILDKGLSDDKKAVKLFWETEAPKLGLIGGLLNFKNKTIGKIWEKNGNRTSQG